MTKRVSQPAFAVAAALVGALSMGAAACSTSDDDAGGSGGTSAAGAGGGGGGGASTVGGGGGVGGQGQAGAGGGGEDERLTWSPSSAGVGDYTSYPKVAIVPGTRAYDGDGGDLWLELPSSSRWEAGPDGGLVIQDARNVALIGGEIYLPDTIPFEETPRRSIYFVGITGTVFVEGLHVHGPGCGDIFTINSDAATFYFQNIRAEISRADEPSDPVHADLIQPWGGHAGVHIDKFTGLTTYQGFQIRRDLADVGPVYLRRTNLGNHPDGGSTANYLLWMGELMDPVHVDGDTFWLAPAPDRSDPKLIHSIWPEPCELASDSLGNYATCPDLRNGADDLVLQDWDGGALGKVREGAPGTGDYVPATSVGVGYVSPGYLE
ncbi:MAG: hypothetical protein JRI23_30985 [Deltaproteobacteria bacterium]|nr:hypothetical protein [Deltaproteobacteria bacterium]MBW2536627.1 hypothetical protein [Deltaproteobacteria bacterium]